MDIAAAVPAVRVGKCTDVYAGDSKGAVPAANSVGKKGLGPWAKTQ